MANDCTGCGFTGATLRRTDASRVEHWWHVECWRTFKAWLRGEHETGTVGEEGEE